MTAMRAVALAADEDVVICFFSVLRLLGFRQVVAHVRHGISELCRNMLSLLIGSIKREHGPIHSPVYVHRRCKNRDKKTKKVTNQNKNRKQATTSPNGQISSGRITAACVLKRLGLAWSNHKSNTSLCKSQEKMQKTIHHVAETQGPPSQDPGDHNEKPTGQNRHLIRMWWYVTLPPRTFGNHTVRIGCKLRFYCT